MKIISQDPTTGAAPDTAPDPDTLLNQQRNDAYDAVHQWLKPDGKASYDLQPFSSEREFLFWSLVELDGGIDWQAAADQKDADGQVTRKGNPMLLLPLAAKLLWLLSHAKEDIRPLRSDRMAMIEAMEAWAATHIPPALHWAAVGLTIQIINEAGVNRAIPRPAEGGLQSGNSPRP